MPINLFKKSHSRQGAERSLYLAYYFRTPTPTNPVRYHTALVVLPSPSPIPLAAAAATCAEPQSDESESLPAPTQSSPTRARSPGRATSPLPYVTTATKFHAFNVPVNENGRGRVTWEFRVERDDPGAPNTPLRLRLVCLLFIGPLSQNVGDHKLEKILKKTNVEAKYMDEFPKYYCTNWMYEALQLLVDEKIIDPLPCSPPDFWEVGGQYADRWMAENHLQVPYDLPIPCCDRAGVALATPMGPVEEKCPDDETNGNALPN
ncbi:hypothetical protein AMATHDRAFT_8092 [Amanita thiersii Skay4041]|uniref:Uncharacterized protein n=1 Tax=Amanita thiersii Skay4041 TaxID=703135 RepID=A0A2A9NEK6_9AGAR|nr:hypothetical protein AMATHDRAFT_8092 [Amanita thiersii Skay4041]